MLLPLLVPSLVVPLTVFGANWAFRTTQGYSLNAPADFLLAVIIFDGGVISASEAFRPLVADSDLQRIVVNWHMLMAAGTAFLWWLIVRYGEPRLDRYKAEVGSGAIPFPAVPFLLCWMGAFVIVFANSAFFFFRG
jgi:hypothetical protein